MPSKITFGASVLLSTASAFAIGALTFNSPFAPPASAPTQTTHPKPNDRADGSEKATEGAQDGTETPTKAEAQARGTATAKAGGKGPFKDAQGDGKYLDDAVSSVVPQSVSEHVPDSLLPFPGREDDLPTGVVPADPDANYPDPDEGTDTSDDVVSGTPGESTNDGAQDGGIPIDSARPGPKPGSGVGPTPSLPTGVVPLPPGVIPAN